MELLREMMHFFTTDMHALGRMANLKTCRQAMVKELAELKLQELVKLKRVVNDDPKRKL